MRAVDPESHTLLLRDLDLHRSQSMHGQMAPPVSRTARAQILLLQPMKVQTTQCICTFTCRIDMHTYNACDAIMIQLVMRMRDSKGQTSK